MIYYGKRLMQYSTRFKFRSVAPYHPPQLIAIAIDIDTIIITKHRPTQTQLLGCQTLKMARNDQSTSHNQSHKHVY